MFLQIQTDKFLAFDPSSSSQLLELTAQQQFVCNFLSIETKQFLFQFALH